LETGAVTSCIHPHIIIYSIIKKNACSAYHMSCKGQIGMGYTSLSLLLIIHPLGAPIYIEF